MKVVVTRCFYENIDSLDELFEISNYGEISYFTVNYNGDLVLLI